MRLRTLTALWATLGLVLLGGLVSCDNKTPGPGVGEGLLLEGCPSPGQATARQITDPAAVASGPDALGTEGDYLLMNERAAFVIQSPERLKTYYHYGGLPIDAVALQGCAQAGQERFSEIGLLVAQADIGTIEHSIMRAFRGDTVEIVNDGSDGQAAHIRVTGTDDVYWLVEYTLIAEAFKAGDPKGRSEPFGLEIVVDYRLEPDRPVLEMAVTLRNLNDTAETFQIPVILSFGDTTEPEYYASTEISFGGFHLEFGLPWLVGYSDDFAWAFAEQEGNVGTTNISGIDAVVNVDDFLTPILLQEAGDNNDSYTRTYFLAVGAGGINSAVRPLHAVNPEPIPGQSYSLAPLSGQVTSAEDSAPIAGAVVEVQREGNGGSWYVLDGFVTDTDGGYAGEIPDFGGGNTRLVVHAEGRASTAPVDLVPGDTTILDVVMDDPGFLAHDIRDDDGTSLPAKITLWQDGHLVRRLYATGVPETVMLPPGDYDVSVTRGYEYSNHQGSITIDANQTTELTVTLIHEVDTSGFLSYDGHVHAEPSPDSRVLVPERIRTAAAAGLDILVSTDHEAISDWSWGVTEAGLDGWITTVIGQEVTASLPEHTNMYPVVRDESHPRGGIPEWYGLDIEEIWAAESTRGAGVRVLNHPRGGCNYLCLIGYDRLLGDASLDDPTLLGLDPGAALWSWDFEGIEYQNGNQDPFLDPADPTRTGLFDDWMSFHNHGHRVTALAVTDVHGANAPGSPRSFFESSTDDPAAFVEQELITAVTEGRVLASTGAFAKVRVNDTAGMGDLITDTDGEIDLHVHIEGASGIDVTYFMVFVNCDEATKIPTADPDAVVKFDATIPVSVPEDAHVVVLGFGEQTLPLGLKQFNPARVPRFTTNPIFIDVDGNATFDAPGGKTCAYNIGPP